MRGILRLLCAFTLAALPIAGARADVTLFDSGAPDGLMATASRPDSPGKAEIESADDFIATGGGFHITGATFTGLIAPGANGGSPTIGQVVVEIYRVFPNDSSTPPSGNVPTRVNSPSDVEFASRDSTSASLTFTTATLSASFTAQNSVLNGINPLPSQHTGGEGAVTGQEVQFSVTFATPLDLPADHYFFVPQVQVTGGEFYWLSSPKPITDGFAFTPDLQSWIRNEALDPDWLKVGGDIVGGGAAFNASFSLIGSAVPEPSSVALLGLGTIALGAVTRRRARRGEIG